MNLPVGVYTRALDMHRDDRGCFTEIFRAEWPTGAEPLQWNLMSSAAGVLRGVHVHPKHIDYLVLAQGRASIGLRDLRAGSATYGLASLLELSGAQLAALVIPPGVAHGFLFHEPSLLVYAVDEYWRADDEMGCHWADPELGIPWPVTSAQTSARDTAAQPFRALLVELAGHRSA